MSRDERHELPTTPAAPAHNEVAPPVPRRPLEALRRSAATWLYDWEMKSYANAASRIAVLARRFVVSVDDLALVCLAGGAPLRLLVANGVDPLLLRGDVDAALRALPPDADRVANDVHEGRTRTAWDRAWARANARAHYDGAAAVDDRALLLACLREPICVTRNVLANRGWDARRIALALAEIEASPPDAPLANSDEVVQLVVGDDGITSPDWLCYVLQHGLDVPHETSHRLAHEVMSQGSTIVAQTAALEARSLRDRMHAIASDLALPVVARLRRVTPSER